MVISELKLKMINTVNSMIDTYFSNNNLTDRFINSTLKIIVKQNIHKLDDVFNLFADKHGEIDTMLLINEYSNMVPNEGIVFNIKDYVGNDLVKNMLPDKVLIIKKEDIMALFT